MDTPSKQYSGDGRNPLRKGSFSADVDQGPQRQRQRQRQSRERGGAGTRKGLARNQQRPRTTAGKPTPGELDRRRRERNQAELEWARHHLPGEDPTFAAAALTTERMARRREVTPAEVLARLKATGRDAETLKQEEGRNE